MNNDEHIKKDKEEPISLDELKTFLWNAATHLRGQIDAAGYKEYIFPMLFFKRISDVYDEQFDGYVHEGGLEFAKMQASDLAIQIPDGAHWNDVRQVTENVGQALVQAFIDIEQANPARKVGNRMVGGLEGIFGPKDGWTNKNKMPDYIITSLIEDFSREKLTLARCPADEMGQAYEYLIGKFADDAGNTAQEFYTNRTVVELMAEILQPKPNESIYDPTCGSGGMLVKCLDYLRRHGEEWQGVHVYGQEINGITSSIARMNLYLNGVEDFSVVRGDTLQNPAFTNGDHLQTFDVVLANPPYSIKEWNRTAFEHDKWGRNFLGTPPQRFADYAFIQHILCSMDEEHGRCAILLPHGILTRLGDELKIRQRLVDSDLVECIISIGKNLFYNSPMEACILICRSRKPLERRHKILFINAKDWVVRENAESYLTDENIQNIVTLYLRYNNMEGRCRVVEQNEIENNNCSLSTVLYTQKDVAQQNVNIGELFDEWATEAAETDASLKEFMQYI